MNWIDVVNELAEKRPGRGDWQRRHLFVRVGTQTEPVRGVDSIGDVIELFLTHPFKPEEIQETIRDLESLATGTARYDNPAIQVRTMERAAAMLRHLQEERER